MNKPAHVDEPYEPYDEDFVDYVECWSCGGAGFSHHDCGEDTCCCLHPEDNVVCDICDGKGGWPRPALPAPS
jgi:hypothetical protein